MTTTTADRDLLEQDLLDRLLTQGAVRTVFQPLVSLDGGAVLGYEALSRGPAGTVLETPDALFAAARRSGRLRDLDAACRTAALRAATEGEATRPVPAVHQRGTGSARRVAPGPGPRGSHRCR